MSSTPHRFDGRLPNLKGSIFIVTYGRSGSTLLQSIVQSIPGAHILGENNNVMLPIWQAFNKVAGAKSAWGQKGGDLPKNPWYGTQDFRPLAFADRLVGAFVDEVLRPPKDARWIGFKEIRYDEFGDDFPRVLDFMARHFKNAYFIFNTRSADAVSKSGWWRERDPDLVKSMIHAQDERFAAYAESRPDRSIVVRYEQLTSDIHCLRPLFELLGEDFDVSRLRKILETRLTH